MHYTEFDQKSKMIKQKHLIH